jgi:hypothetical protein
MSNALAGTKGQLNTANVLAAEQQYRDRFRGISTLGDNWIMQKSKRDSHCVHIFEAADDALQGYLGLHHYAKQLHSEAIPLLISKFAASQDTIDIQITHDWQRRYSMKSFVENMANSFEFAESRALVLPTVAIFETAVRRFFLQLYDLGKLGPRERKLRRRTTKSYSGGHSWL